MTSLYSNVHTVALLLLMHVNLQAQNNYDLLNAFYKAVVVVSQERDLNGHAMNLAMNI